MSTHILQIAHDVIQSSEWKKAASKFSSDLCGMCAIASAIAFKALKRNGVDVKICANDDHCWLHVLVDGTTYALDLTAKQFGFYGSVLFCPADKVLETMGRDLKADCYAKSWWEGCESFSKFNSLKELRDWQKINDWPVEQIV